MNSVRFTAYLSEREREGIAQLAREHGTSENYMVRLAIRRMLGLNVPAPLANGVIDTGVTSVTRNN